MSDADERFMGLALAMAELGRYTVHPNPRVGCIIVCNGEIIGEGAHLWAGEAHAEIRALQDARQRLGARADAALAGSTLYVTLEPCSHRGRTGPCTDALLEAGVARVVAACTDPNPRGGGHGLEHLRTKGVEVKIGVLETRARAINAGFMQRFEQGRPRVLIKLAMSLDGRTAMASGESKWITGAEARAQVQHLRAQSDAVLTGPGTVLADDPRLDVRALPDAPEVVASRVLERQPLRLVADTHLRTPPGARLLATPGRAVILTREALLGSASAKVLGNTGAELLGVPVTAGRLDLQAALHLLADVFECNQVLAECGPTLAGALLRQGLADEIHLFVAGLFMGPKALPLLDLPGLDTLADAIRLDILEVTPCGGDWHFKVAPKDGVR